MNIQLIEVKSKSPGKWFKYEIISGKELVGTVETEHSNFYVPPAFVIYKLVIGQNHRRKGIGRYVIDHFKKVAASEKCSRIMAKIHSLDDDVSEGDLTRFYLTCGFKLDKINGDLFAVIELNEYREKY